MGVVLRAGPGGHGELGGKLFGRGQLRLLQLGQVGNVFVRVDALAGEQAELLLVPDPAAGEVESVVGGLEIVNEFLETVVEERHGVHQGDVVDLEDLELLGVEGDGVQRDLLALQVQLPVGLLQLGQGPHDTVGVEAWKEINLEKKYIT